MSDRDISIMKKRILRFCARSCKDSREEMKRFDTTMDEKKKALFLEQKKTLDIFLSKGAITKAQYDKSYGDLVKLMGMEEVAKNLESEEKR